MLSERQLLALGQAVLAEVKRLDPKAAASVNLTTVRRGHTRFARNEITTSGENDQLGLRLTVQLGLRSASASTNQSAPDALRALVQRTLSTARLSPEFPETMPLLGPAKVARVPLHDPSLASMDPKARAEGVARALAPSLERNLLTAGFLAVFDGQRAQLNSAGLSLVHPYSEAGVSLTARTRDGTGSGWAAVNTRRRAELDLSGLGHTAAQKALASAQPRAFAPGRYTVVLEPAAVQELLGYFVGALDRRAIDEGRSALVGKLGQRVLSEALTLRSDPQRGSMLPFDDEGMPLVPRTWVDRGVLQSVGVSRYWAQHQKLTATGNYGGYELAAGEASRAQLLAGVTRGVLITRLWYSNLVDPRRLLVTGLTRDGTFLIEDGAVTTPIKNFRINQSVLDALAAVDLVSVDQHSPGAASWRVPAVRTHDFLLASPTDAV